MTTDMLPNDYRQPGRCDMPPDESEMRAVDESEIKGQLELLQQEHRDLDSAIEALAAATGSDQLQLARLKKRKLRLKDEISQLTDQLIPDIIA